MSVLFRGPSSPAEEAPAVVQETPVPDAYARAAARRHQRVEEVQNRFSTTIGDRIYDPDDRAAFDGQVDAATADWSTEDVRIHNEYRGELAERRAAADGAVTMADNALADAEKDLREADQKVLNALRRLGFEPPPEPAANGRGAGFATPPRSSDDGPGSAAGPPEENKPPAPGQPSNHEPPPPPGPHGPVGGQYFDEVALLQDRPGWWLWVLVAFAVGGDIAAFYVVLELLFRSYPVITVLAVLAFAAIAVMLSHAVGRAWRRRVARDPDRSDAWLWVPLIGWILLGAAAFTGRLFFASLGAGSSVFGAPTPIGNAGAGLDVLPAVIFAALYIGSGICAMYASYEAYNPAAAAYRLARPLRDEARKKVQHCAGACTEARTRQERAASDEERAPKRLARAQIVTFNEVVGVKHFVRHRMAGNTDNPRGLALFMAGPPEPKDLPDEEE